MGIFLRQTAALCALVMISGGDVAIGHTSPPPSASRDETADRVAIERLTIEYSYLLDHGRAGELAALFTPNGVLETPGAGSQIVGREAIAAYYARRAADPRTTRHVSTNLRLVFETPDRASGTRLILYYRGDGAGPPFPAKPAAVGEYTESFRRGRDGKWRFASRVNAILFSDEGRGDAK
jgi:hypothetical protein